MLYYSYKNIIRKENYEEIAKHWKNEGHKSLSNYVNSLIREDMAKGGGYRQTILKQFRQIKLQQAG